MIINNLMILSFIYSGIFILIALRSGPLRSDLLNQLGRLAVALPSLLA